MTCTHFLALGVQSGVGVASCPPPHQLPIERRSVLTAPEPPGPAKQVRPEEVELIRRDYTANGGWETFLEYGDPRQVGGSVPQPAACNFMECAMFCCMACPPSCPPTATCC